MDKEKLIRFRKFVISFLFHHSRLNEDFKSNNVVCEIGNQTLNLNDLIEGFEFLKKELAELENDSTPGVSLSWNEAVMRTYHPTFQPPQD